MAVGVANSSDRNSVDSVSILEALCRAAERLWAWFHFFNPFYSAMESRGKRTLNCSERERIVRELHDTLLQGFLGASLLLDASVEQVPADSPFKPSLSRALSLVHQAVDDGRKVLQGQQPTGNGSEGLDRAFMRLQDELSSARDVRLRILVKGKRRALASVVEEQIHRICREGVVNALRHSGATLIEVKVEYARRAVRVSVRDNGCGFDSTVVQSAWDSHWGLRSMHERATSIGADLRIWSRPGAGTEIEISFPATRAGGWPTR
ncbi:MAG TPA: ATP-binding protein [Candidatus Acidoferrum sp.]|nr:ATP-binding protein [Candidatus Acidoferrum sp.]